eukprot:261414_1
MKWNSRWIKQICAKQYSSQIPYANVMIFRNLNSSMNMNHNPFSTLSQKIHFTQQGPVFEACTHWKDENQGGDDQKPPEDPKRIRMKAFIRRFLFYEITTVSLLFGYLFWWRNPKTQLDQTQTQWETEMNYGKEDRDIQMQQDPQNEVIPIQEDSQRMRSVKDIFDLHTKTGKWMTILVAVWAW